MLKRSRAHRRRYGEVFVEGVRPIQRLVDAGWSVRAVCSEAGRALSPWAESVLRASRTPLHQVLAPELMAQLSDREQPSELLVVAAMRAPRLADLALPPGALVVVLDRPASPGNLGTVLRSADALGAGAVLVSGHAADPYDPHAIRASMGSVFTMPPVEMAGAAELERWLASRPGTLVLGTDSSGDAALPDVDLRGSTVVVIGNEAAGASHGLRALCRTMARIPMVGSADSLNMAVAASIVLYESARQRADNPTS